MAVRETIKDAYYRSYDAENDAWIRHAFWTKASQVECNDGKDVETKITEEIDAKIKELEQSFQGGCSVIADAITGGRDGNGTGGVPTAADASLNVMSDNITQMAIENYNDGIAYADSRVNNQSASYTAGRAVTTQTFSKSSSEQYPTYFDTTIECKPGYTLNKDMFVCFGGTVWTYADGTAYASQGLTTTLTQTGNLLKYHGYRVKSISGTIYYIGAASVPYALYAVSISGVADKTDKTWTYDGTNYPYVHGAASGKVYVKIDGTTVSIYSNTTQIRAYAAGDGNGHTVTPLGASISGVSMSNQSNGQFTLTVSGSGSSGGGACTSSVQLTVTCLVSNGTMSVAPNGTITAYAQLGNMTATGSIGASVTKMI